MKTFVFTMAAATVAGALIASPAQAAAVNGVVSIAHNEVTFKATKGKQNRIVVTRSGRTVTIDDRAAIKAGTGCKPVKGDRTRVRCTMLESRGSLAVFLYDRDDSVVNKTWLPMHALGGAGNDRIVGGAIYDLLYGQSGRDEIHGGGGRDTINGGAGNDRIFGESDDDWLQGDSGNDVIHGGASNDRLFGMAGSDRLYGGAGNDFLDGYDQGAKQARDLLDGGANRTAAGDTCKRYTYDLRSGCES